LGFSRYLSLALKEIRAEKFIPAGDAAKVAYGAESRKEGESKSKLHR
jgi:hypothetical protein